MSEVIGIPGHDRTQRVSAFAAYPYAYQHADLSDSRDLFTAVSSLISDRNEMMFSETLVFAPNRIAEIPCSAPGSAMVRSNRVNSSSLADDERAIITLKAIPVACIVCNSASVAQ